jgi:hypothetical protein
LDTSGRRQVLEALSQYVVRQRLLGRSAARALHRRLHSEGRHALGAWAAAARAEAAHGGLLAAGAAARRAREALGAWAGRSTLGTAGARARALLGGRRVRKLRRCAWELWVRVTLRNTPGRDARRPESGPAAEAAEAAGAGAASLAEALRSVDATRAFLLRARDRNMKTRLLARHVHDWARFAHCSAVDSAEHSAEKVRLRAPAAPRQCPTPSLESLTASRETPTRNVDTSRNDDPRRLTARAPRGAAARDARRAVAAARRHHGQRRQAHARHARARLPARAPQRVRVARRLFATCRHFASAAARAPPAPVAAPAAGRRAAAVAAGEHWARGAPPPLPPY